MKDPQPGELRERVTIERDTGSSENIQGHVPEWSRRFTVWALVRQLSQRETFIGEQVSTDSTHKIIVRFSDKTADLTTQDRLAWRGKTIHIEAIDNPGNRNRWLVITGKLTE